MTYRSESIEIANAKIHVQRAGEGDPVLFLHGAGGLPVWLPLLQELSKTFDVVAPDHPGFGKSDTPPWLVGVSDAVYCYLELLERVFPGKKVKVVGTSLGGWIAAEAAVRSLEKIESLTLIAPAGVRVKGIHSGDNFIWSPEEHARKLFFNQKIADVVLSTSTTPESMEVQLKNRFAAARYGWQPRFFNPELQRWLSRIKVPVQIIWGENDELLPVGYAKAWQDGLPDCRLTTIKECGHLPHVEKADDVLRIFYAFVSR